MNDENDDYIWLSHLFLLYFFSLKYMTLVENCETKWFIKMSIRRFTEDYQNIRKSKTFTVLVTDEFVTKTDRKYGKD